MKLMGLRYLVGARVQQPLSVAGVLETASSNEVLETAGSSGYFENRWK